MSLKLPQLLKLFKKSHNEDVAVFQPFSPFPVELWDYIASMVENQGDLSRLYRTSRTLRSICEPYLYRSIKICNSIHKKEINKRLLRTIQTPRIKGLVECFHLTPGTTHGSGYIPPRTPKHPLVHKSIGKVMIRLHNLQKLAIECDSHDAARGCYSLYIDRLETRRLTMLRWKMCCATLFLYDGSYRNSAQSLRILSAPCMQRIVSLSFVYLPQARLSSTDLSIIENDSFLPCLKEITCRDVRLFGQHLRRGAITSLHTRINALDLAIVLSKCPPGLMHLDCFRNGLENIIPHIIHSPYPYLKLRSMGQLVFHDLRDLGEIVARLKGLSCLPHLSCIQLSIYLRRPSSFRSRLTFVQDLHQELRKLSKIYMLTHPVDHECFTQKYEVWELASGTWQSGELNGSLYFALYTNEGRLIPDLE